MSDAPPSRPFLQARRPWWQPLVSLFVTLVGILWGGWGLQAVVFLFWWETMLIVAAALVRVLFALDSKPVLHTILPKLGSIVFGVMLGGAAILLAVALSLEGMSKEFDGSITHVGTESRLLLASYAVGLIIHYFLNGKFRTANPIAEVLASMMHLLIVLIFIMPVTMWILPAYPEHGQSLGVALTVVLAKFTGDALFTRYSEDLKKSIADSLDE